MELDRILPNFDFSEVHSTWVPVSPEVTDAAFRALTLRETRLLRPLMWLRTLPAMLTGTDVPGLAPDRTLIAALGEMGFATYVDLPGREYLFGEISRPWHLSLDDMKQQHVETSEQFVGFDKPSFVKIAANYRYQPVDGGTRVTTETRVAGTTQDATNRFRLYWWVIRGPSGLIRRSMLAGLRRRISRCSEHSEQTRAGAIT